MALMNCSRCGELYDAVSQDICQKCIEEEEELLSAAQEYLRTHRTASKYTIIDELDIESSMLEKWIKEKRLTFITSEEFERPSCAHCGRKLSSDDQVICKTCRLKKALSEEKPLESKAYSKPVSEEAPKSSKKGMHYKRFIDR